MRHPPAAAPIRRENAGFSSDVELGLQPHLADRDEDFTSAYDFDFVIGSTHLCRGMDPYYPEYFEKFSSEEEAIRTILRRRWKI